MTASETQELIRLAAAGDAAAFARLLDGHYMIIYKTAYKWCGHKADAEDIAQNVCMKLAEKLPSFRGDASFASWLYRLTINAAKDYYRTTGRAGSREKPFAEGFDVASGETPTDEKLIAAQHYAAIHALPPELCDAVLLVFGEDMNHRDAAKILGCAETTISWRIHKARKILKERGIAYG